jgi:hypothetical protein
MDVGIISSIIVGDRIDDDLRALARRRVVQIDEGLAVHSAGEDGKVALDALKGFTRIGSGSHGVTFSF